jgi:hypothetical protein
MRARLAFHDKQVLRDGSIVEMKIWEVPESVRGSKHRLKYSLFYGRAITGMWKARKNPIHSVRRNV